MRPPPGSAPDNGAGGGSRGGRGGTDSGNSSGGGVGHGVGGGGGRGGGIGGWGRAAGWGGFGGGVGGGSDGGTTPRPRTGATAAFAATTATPTAVVTIPGAGTSAATTGTSATRMVRDDPLDRPAPRAYTPWWVAAGNGGRDATAVGARRPRPLPWRGRGRRGGGGRGRRAIPAPTTAATTTAAVTIVVVLMVIVAAVLFHRRGGADVGEGGVWRWLHGKRRGGGGGRGGTPGSAVEVLTAPSGVTLCRVGPACVDASGRLALPAWVGAHPTLPTTLSATCGLPAVDVVYGEEGRDAPFGGDAGGSGGGHTEIAPLDWVGPGVHPARLAALAGTSLAPVYGRGGHWGGARLCVAPPPENSAAGSGDGGGDGGGGGERGWPGTSPCDATGGDDKAGTAASAVLAAALSLAPAILADVPGLAPGGAWGGLDGRGVATAHAAFRSALGGRLAVVHAASALAGGGRLCFRSVVLTPAAVISGREEWGDGGGGMGVPHLGTHLFDFEGVDILAAEGGVELLTITSPTGQRLATGCRLYRVCRSSADGALLLPAWAGRHADALATACGIDHARFVTGLERVWTEAATADALDLLGPTMPRDGAANAFLATLLPKLPVIDALFRPLEVDAVALAAADGGNLDGGGGSGGDGRGHGSGTGGLPSTAGPPTVVHRRCLYASAGTVAGVAAHGSGLCNGSRAAPSSLRPAVLLPEVVRHTPKSGLVKAVVTRLLPHRLDGGGGDEPAVPPPVPAHQWPRSLYGGDIRRAGDGATTCYRSVVAAPRRLPPPDALVGALTFFASNRLSRSTAPPPPPPCVVPVTLLQPHEPVASDGGAGRGEWDTWEAGRGLGASAAGGMGGSGDGGGAVGFPPALANAEALISALHSRARTSVNARRLRGGLALHVRVVRPSRMLTRELMAALQATRVLLAPHDPTIAAMLFLRPGATLVEVAPFAYYGGGGGGVGGLPWRGVPAGGSPPRHAHLSFLRRGHGGRRLG
ncbi:hypothetical protein MMPV_003054 [Pyropia vietnamensis]